MWRLISDHFFPILLRSLQLALRPNQLALRPLQLALRPLQMALQPLWALDRGTDEWMDGWTD